MAVIMKQADKKADIFIDAFTGGGKMGLSIPKGWFDTIVINDLIKRYKIKKVSLFKSLVNFILR